MSKKESFNISCRQASELVEKKLEARLPFFDKIRLKWHTLYCAACRQYEAKSAKLDDMLKRALKDRGKGIPLPPDDVEALKKKVLRKAGQ